MGALNDYIDEVGEDTLLQVVNKKWVLTALDRYTTTINVIYPVGSIYMSVNNINPGTYLTGTTWVAWGSGKVPVGVNTDETEFDSVEKTGGAKSHTLTVNEMPRHSHSITDPGHLYKFYDRWIDGAINAMNDTLRMANHNTQNTKTTTNTAGISIQNSGDSQSHNNLQPYITCYMWKRIT